MKPPKRWHGNHLHRSYGIKNWLLTNGYCLSKSGDGINKNEYADLIERFYLTIGSKTMELNRWEQFVQDNFDAFKKFVKSEN